MSIRLDPRRLAALKLLAAEAGVRPGEMVTAWVEERLDAARAGKATASGAVGALPNAQLTALAARVDELARRLDAMPAPDAGSTPAQDADAAASETEPPRRVRRPKRAGDQPAATRASDKPAGPRIPLHEEIAEVIRERGPMSAGDIAAAIQERGRYAAPRSSRPLDAATVNSRVSNPAYRDRFARSEGRIRLSDATSNSAPEPSPGA